MDVKTIVVQVDEIDKTKTIVANRWRRPPAASSSLDLLTIPAGTPGEAVTSSTLTAIVRLRRETDFARLGKRPGSALAAPPEPQSSLKARDICSVSGFKR
jgi:hypothetical protein